MPLEDARDARSRSSMPLFERAPPSHPQSASQARDTGVAFARSAASNESHPSGVPKVENSSSTPATLAAITCWRNLWHGMPPNTPQPQRPVDTTGTEGIDASFLRLDSIACLENAAWAFPMSRSMVVRLRWLCVVASSVRIVNGGDGGDRAAATE